MPLKVLANQKYAAAPPAIADINDVTAADIIPATGVIHKETTNVIIAPLVVTCCFLIQITNYFNR